MLIGFVPGPKALSLFAPTGNPGHFNQRVRDGGRDREMKAGEYKGRGHGVPVCVFEGQRCVFPVLLYRFVLLFRLF